MASPEIEARFWRHVRKTETCWVWKRTPFVRQRGKEIPTYGMFRGWPEPGNAMAAHRVSWELHFGPIPPGMIVCHRCDNRPCVRPDHLFVGTYQDNSQDMVTKGRCYAEPMPPGSPEWMAIARAKIAAKTGRSTYWSKAWRHLEYHQDCDCAWPMELIGLLGSECLGCERWYMTGGWNNRTRELSRMGVCSEECGAKTVPMATALVFG